MKLCLSHLLLFILLCSVAETQAAQPAKEFAFDPAHCSITFKVRHIFVDIPGRFGEFAGTFRFDPKNPEGSLFDITVKADSLDTFVDKRNAHLRSADFFDAAKFPDIHFKSSKIIKKSETQFVVKGTMTLKGVSCEIEVPFTYFGKKANPMDPAKEVAGFATKLTLHMPDYSFCDPKWSAMGIISQDALLEINFEMLSDK